MNIFHNYKNLFFNPAEFVKNALKGWPFWKYLIALIILNSAIWVVIGLFVALAGHIGDKVDYVFSIFMGIATSLLELAAIFFVNIPFAAKRKFSEIYKLNLAVLTYSLTIFFILPAIFVAVTYFIMLSNLLAVGQIILWGFFTYLMVIPFAIFSVALIISYLRILSKFYKTEIWKILLWLVVLFLLSYTLSFLN